jgi:hypothetical protein
MGEGTFVVFLNPMSLLDIPSEVHEGLKWIFEVMTLIMEESCVGE